MFLATYLRFDEISNESTFSIKELIIIEIRIIKRESFIVIGRL
jgi:hypothetical protein